VNDEIGHLSEFKGEEKSEVGMPTAGLATDRRGEPKKTGHKKGVRGKTDAFNMRGGSKPLARFKSA